MCGASQQQENLATSQSNFYNQLTSQYQTEFSQNQAILSNLTKTLTPIINAGPSQQGYSPEEIAALNAQATEGTAAGYRSTATAMNEQEAALGGGNSPITSAAQEQLQSTAMTNAENQLTNAKTGILQSGFQQGATNFANATGQLVGAVGGTENPLSGAAGATTGAGSSAMTGATDVNNANNQWEGLLGGLASSALSGGIQLPTTTPPFNPATSGQGLID